MKWILLLSYNPEWGQCFKKNIWFAFFWALSIPGNQRQFCSKEVITDGWSEEHRDSRFISPPAAWGSTSSLSTHQSLQKSFITSSNASSSLKPESLSTLIHSCLEFIVVWLSLVLLLCSSLSSTSPPAVSWETPMEYEQLLDAVDVSGHRGNRSLSEILCGNPGRLWNRN